eukprot:2034527-Amphidinium_carterae.1
MEFEPTSMLAQIHVSFQVNQLWSTLVCHPDTSFSKLCAQVWHDCGVVASERQREFLGEVDYILDLPPDTPVSQVREGSAFSNGSVDGDPAHQQTQFSCLDCGKVRACPMAFADVAASARHTRRNIMWTYQSLRQQELNEHKRRYA